MTRPWSSVIELADNRDGYISLLELVTRHGEKVTSQYGDTIELRNASIVLHDPHDALPSGINRGFSPGLVAFESLMLIGGFMDDERTTDVVPSMDRFKEDNGQFWGSYGRRTRDQLAAIVRKLQCDPDTRQAVVTVWDPALDAQGGKRDHPCTIALQFLIRDDKLSLCTTMRSNDVWWGWAHDAGQFTSLQLTVANVLGIEPGPYVHNAKSFHLYIRDLPSLGRLSRPDLLSRPEIPNRALGWKGAPWEAVQAQARVLAYLPPDSHLAVASDSWYVDSIHAAIKRNELKARGDG